MLHVCMCTLHIPDALRVQKWVLDAHEQRKECWEPNSAPLQEQPGLITAEAWLQAKAGVLSILSFINFFPFTICFPFSFPSIL